MHGQKNIKLGNIYCFSISTVMMAQMCHGVAFICTLPVLLDLKAEMEPAFESLCSLVLFRQWA